MLKYHNYMVVFEEIPNEITLAVNITNCPCRCIGCHSKFLWEDTGTPLTTDELCRIIENNRGITCVCFMGGDSNPSDVDYLSSIVRDKGLKVAWYSGMDTLSDKIRVNNFDYIKIGHYNINLGGLSKKDTNQRLYKIDTEGKMVDITPLFWKEMRS